MKPMLASPAGPVIPFQMLLSPKLDGIAKAVYRGSKGDEMKDDQIVILGKNADAYANNQTSDSFDWKLIRDARFAQLVAAAEREACANLLQELEAMLEAVGAGGVSAQRVTQGKGHIEQDLKMVAVQEPFGYFKAEPFGWRDCAETDEGAIALYEAPQPQADARDTERLDWLIEQGCSHGVVYEGSDKSFWMVWLDGHDAHKDEHQIGRYHTAREAIDAAIAAAKEKP